MKAIRRGAPRHTSASRDAALRRLGHANRWVLAGTAVLTGLFTELAASAFSGHSAHAASGTGAGSRTHAHHQQTTPLKPPAQAPKPAEQQPSEAPARTEETPAEAPAPSEPEQQAAPEVREPEVREPEVHESAPPPEPSEPVVSGGS